MGKDIILCKLKKYPALMPVHFAFGWHPKGNALHLPLHVVGRHNSPRTVQDFINWLEYQPADVEVFSAGLIKYPEDSMLLIQKLGAEQRLAFGADTVCCELYAFANCMYLKESGTFLNLEGFSQLNKQSKLFFEQLILHGKIDHDFIFDSITESENSRYKIVQNLRNIVGADLIQTQSNQGYRLGFHPKKMIVSDTPYSEIEAVERNNIPEQIYSNGPSLYQSKFNDDYVEFKIKLPRFKTVRKLCTGFVKRAFFV